MHSKTLLTLLILIVAISLGFSQDLVLEPYGVSPAAIKADTVGDPSYLGIRDRVSTGILNVGVETKMYMMATFEDSSITGLTWTMMEQPGTSTATLSGATEVDDASEIVTFVPDKIGTYKVSVSEGTFGDTIVINAGTFLGADGAAPTCAQCHSTTFAKWQETGHANHLTDALDGLNRSGTSCLKCHTTGFDADATNDGFDDFDFLYPDTQYVGMSDSIYTKYPDAAIRANIQCESCHGPGSEHKGNKSDSKMVVDIGVDACAACHDDDHYHVYPSQWAVSKHANPDAQFTRTSCAPCHNGMGFIEYVKGGKTGLDEEPDANYDISCAVCHDPHDVTNEYQLRTVESTLGNGTEVVGGGLGTLCMNCHKSRRDGLDYVENYLDNLSSHYGPHHGPQADILMAKNIPTFGMDLPSSAHFAATEDACVSCHMYEKGSHGEHDEDGDLNTSGMHSFAMVSQKGVDNVSACSHSGCHGDFGPTFDDKKFIQNGSADLDGDGEENGLQTEIQGLLDTLILLIPHDEEMHPMIEDSSVTPEEAEAAYIYLCVYEDRSLGVHNPAFAATLLQTAIDKLKGVSSVDTRGFTPLEYELSQNYPNPFNPTTEIAYTIRTAGHVEIMVYDVLGRQVATLVNKEMIPGKYTVNFDAGNLASGVYIYRIQAGAEFAAVKKMVLIK